MPRCFSRNDVVRVSSARMKSTSRRIFTARSVMSSRFPIGVGTIYSSAIVSGEFAFEQFHHKLAPSELGFQA